MKIIIRGTKPSEAIHRVTCGTCRSVLEFQRSEGTITYNQRDGDCIGITCPVCESPISADLKGSRYDGPGYHSRD